MRFLPLAFAAVWCTGILTTVASAQAPAPAGQDALSTQQQSIMRQMEAITSTSAEKQANSIRQQAESLRRQSGVPDPNKNADSLAQATPKVASDKGAKQTASASDPQNAAAPATENTYSARTGFYTTPWPQSSDFAMPNVQVQTASCEALENSEIEKLVSEASNKNKIDAKLLRAVMVQESGFRPCAVSTAGAMGLMQIMPETADDLGLAEPFDPAANVDAGARYLKQMLDRYHGNTALALAAYNAGPGRTDKANGIPPITETIGYVSNILNNIPLY
jgi:soluble lytic murein transglycosylase-like protein